MGSFSTSLSGIKAASNNLAVISNNLANMNTTAYKSQEANFKDLFYQLLGTNGAGNAVQVGAGTTIAAVASNFTQGTVSSNGVSTDVAIQGEGSFIESKDGTTLYTRAGNFAQDQSGNLVTSDGGYVLGYPAVDGVISSSQTLAPLKLVSGQIIPPKASSQVELQMNLDASASAVAGVNGNTFSSPVVVYDSLGTSHTLTFTFTKTAPNTWNYAITIPGGDVGASGAPTTVGSGVLQFDNNGKLTSPAADVSGISIPSLADGATPMSLKWSLFGPSGSSQITQVSGDSNVSSTQQDGYASGSLQSFTINSDGTISGSFSNGKTHTLGQIALATFQNNQGLQLVGSNTYSATPSAGTASVGAPNSGGRGSLVGESLEASNVDMTSELSDLIVAERDYQSNARAISTANEMTQYVLTKL